MVVGDSEELVGSLREIAGADLRAVAAFTQEDYDVVYRREGIESRLERLAPDIHEDLVLQGIGKEYLEKLFEAGELHCSMHRFEDISVFHFHSGSGTGLFVSIDSGADVPLYTFARTCERHL